MENMYCKVLMFLYLVNFISYSSSGEFSEQRIKRTDIDLQTCIDNFDIHKDKIIRTQDSQKMGAKYLNEIDLGSREECLRLCCETDSCDVFVFEEKNSGSCYLFHCGPPGDFKCKFTHHVNYSSAILAINRHLPDLESQIKLTKHEQDLNKLRKPESDPEVIPQVQQVQTTPSATTTTLKVKEVVLDSQKTPPPDSRSKCSRYQFECRSTGECIAIYNACDGIPQCADASDEAPELGCPDTLTTSQPPIPPHLSNSNPIRTRYEQPAPPPRAHQPAVNIVQEKYRQPVIQENIPQQAPSSIQRPQESDFIRPAPDLRTGYDARIPYDNAHVPSYPVQAAIHSSANWVPRQSNPMPQAAPQYSDKNSHIFNHKESGLQVSDGPEISQIQYAEPVNSRDYQKVPGYYPDSYRPNIPQENWNVPPEDPRYNNMRYSGQEVTNKDWRPDISQAYRDSYNNMDSKISTFPEQPRKEVAIKQPVSEKPASIPTDKVSENPKHIQEKMAHELKQSKNQAAHTDVITEPKIKIERHRHVEQEHYPDVVAYKMDGPADIRDGKAETPGGAVLSLTFGLIVTCIMAILIGCRLRVVRRRMRKGGKSYAHDADYLVNGMYL